MEPKIRPEFFMFVPELKPAGTPDEGWLAVGAIRQYGDVGPWCEVWVIAPHPLRVVRKTRVPAQWPHAWCPIPGTRTIVGAGAYPGGGSSDIVWLPYDGSGKVRTVPGPLPNPGFNAAANERCAWYSSLDPDGKFARVPLSGDEAPSAIDTGFPGKTALALGATSKFLGVVASRFDRATKLTDLVAILYAVSGADLTEVGRATLTGEPGVVEDVAVLESRPAIVVALQHAGGRIIPFGPVAHPAPR